MNRIFSVPVLLGPTASSKTSVGIQLAKRLNGEVISVDSRKVYRGLPVGTATPLGQWRDGTYWVDGVAHHLMGHLAPDHAYTAGDFARDAERLIQDITGRGRVPILVGGTGFYFKALQQGLPPLPERDDAFRNGIEARIAVEGTDAVHAELARQDPAAASEIRSNDRHKIIRALEVLHATGRPYSDWKKEKKPTIDRSFVVLGIDATKLLLDKRIEERSAAMVKDGMLEETEAVLEAGYPATCPALMSFGYKEAVQVVTGVLPRHDFLPLLIKGTKAYAKRQRTWFRTQVQPVWFPWQASSKSDEIAVKMKAFLETRPSGK